MIAAAWGAGDTYMAVAVALLLTLSGFFALAETSLTRMNRSRARALSDEGRRGARALAALTERPEQFLNPLLLLVLICQLVSATLVGVLAGHLFGAAGVFVATALEVVVIFVAFEAIPKNFALAHLDEAALVTAPVVGRLLRWWPVRFVSSALNAVAEAVIRLVVPGRAPRARITESEVLAMADVAHEDKAIESTEREFIHSVIEFGDTVVREIMVPRLDVVHVDDAATVREALEVSLSTGRSRLPVIDGGIDDVVGMVNLRHLARLVAEGHGAERVAAHRGEARFVPETKRVATLLTEMRRDKTHLYVVVDEYGGTAGLVTLEDVLEELVGEIVDESDVEAPGPEAAAGPGVEVSGRLNIDDANEEFDLELPKDGWDTVGGLVLDLAGGVPREGDVFVTERYRLTVTRVEGRRVEAVRVEVAPQ